MDLVIRFGHTGERILVSGWVNYRGRKGIVVAENVGYPLGKLGMKRKGKKEYLCKKDFTEDTKEKVNGRERTEQNPSEVR